MSKNICLYLHAHQPYRLTKLNYLELGSVKEYFLGSPESNQFYIDKIASKSYLPTNKVLLKLLQQHPEFRLSLSISGVLIEQLKKFRPDVLKSFQKLVATGRVELICETYYHSLASIYSVAEFCAQIALQYKTLEQTFGYSPTSFRNTELIYNDYIATVVQQLGFRTIITEGWDKVLGKRNSNHVYEANLTQLSAPDKAATAQWRLSNTRPAKQLKLLLKNYKLSDDIAFRFSNQAWEEYPLTITKYFRWLDDSEGELINLFMDYETFGEHQWEDTGIFEFLAEMPAAATEHNIGFRTISEAAAGPAQARISVTDTISWADLERDTSAWNGNRMQQTALGMIYNLEQELGQKLPAVRNNNLRQRIWEDWRRLQTSDHFYYMCTKYWSDGDVHKYFSPYESPYEAFINFMNIVEDFSQKFNYELAKLKHAPARKLRKTD